VGKATGFLEYPREVPARRPPAERIHDWFEIYQPFPEEKIRAQGARCMDCGVPFCHTGCPLTNIIPDWNDLVYRGRWQDAIRVLHATNNFPEFTGRICPAPCEAACVLGINEPPVTIKQIEKTIVDRAFDEGWIRPEPPETLTGKRVAIVGSGPAGLAAAQQLRRAGHAVTVFEKNDKIGGLLRYGIPNFKLEKQYVDRRLDQMRAEGVEFVPNAHIGHDVPVADLRRDYDAILLSGGAEHPRDLPVPGRELHGIHFAMEFLGRASTVTAAGKRVVIIGGGDTGADCLGTSHRQKAVSVHQFELLAKPPLERASSTPWPLWPMQLRTESSHEEGGIREWRVSTTAFTGDQHGNLKQLHATRLDTNEAFTMDADLVLLAMGFLGPVKAGLLDTLGVKLDQRGNVQTDGYMTGIPGIFAAGDMRRGQSLVVWAIAEGRQAAAAIDRYLMGRRL